MINKAFQYLFVITFFAIMAIGGKYQCDRNRKVRIERDGLIDLATHSVDTHRNYRGEPYATVPVIELSATTLRLVNPELDSIEERFNTFTKRTVSFISIETERNNHLRLVGKDTIIGADTVKFFQSGQSTYIQKGDSLIVKEKSGKINTYVVIRKGKRDRWWKIWTKRPTKANVYITDSLVDIKNFKVHQNINQ